MNTTKNLKSFAVENRFKSLYPLCAMSHDFSITVATVNGSGSQSANMVLVKSLFRHGVPVGAKNLFPSNIAGLPTWFSIRVNPEGYVGRKARADIIITRNQDTLSQDLENLTPGGFLFLDSEFKNLNLSGRTDAKVVTIPYRELTQELSDVVRLRKLLSNMVYVGIVCELLNLEEEIVNSVVRDQFAGKEKVVESNTVALKIGREYVRSHPDLRASFPYKVDLNHPRSTDSILVDGNSAAAFGSVAGGGTFLAWYPITPASSLAENFEQYAHDFRPKKDGKNNFASVQAEDELSAINMVIGAGWAGARAMTSTSGPGLSLMSEGAGLSYFAEIPAVIWDVQRVGPSTGLPTRTMQGDVRAAHHLSHGDTEHVVLIPATPLECFEFGQTAFDLAEMLQTLVIVLSDLDLGMNYRICKQFPYSEKEFNRGKVLSAEALNSVENFARYQDVDGDGICFRTLPGTMHANAAYFTRGTGHNEKSGYTEDGKTFAALIDRLKRKIRGNRHLLPTPVVEINPDSEIGLICYGSTDEVMPEIRALMKKIGIPTSYLRIRSLPLHDEIRNFIEHHEKVVVIEQNRDAQMLSFLTSEFPDLATKMQSALNYDGMPICAETFIGKIMSENSRGGGH